MVLPWQVQAEQFLKYICTSASSLKAFSAEHVVLQYYLLGEMFRFITIKKLPKKPTDRMNVHY